MSEGLRQPVFTAAHVNPPTTLGQAWRTEPNKHFGSRNANTTSFPNKFLENRCEHDVLAVQKSKSPAKMIHKQDKSVAFYGLMAVRCPVTF